MSCAIKPEPEAAGTAEPARFDGVDDAILASAWELNLEDFICPTKATSANLGPSMARQVVSVPGQHEVW